MFVKEAVDMKKHYSLVGVDGNAFSVMAYTKKAMKESGFSGSEIDEYLNKATSSDYNNLLCLSAKMVEKCNK